MSLGILHDLLYLSIPYVKEILYKHVQVMFLREILFAMPTLKELVEVLVSQMVQKH